jgi:5-carboxymethyl-2-hydroxymuconate isomerase
MPHFVIDCSENVTVIKKPEEIMLAVYETAESTGLFAAGDIKVRINPFTHFKLGPSKESFIHVFGNIMEGRTTDQKSSLSRQIITRLTAMFPDVPIISINIRDFEKATYCNRLLL